MRGSATLENVPSMQRPETKAPVSPHPDPNDFVSLLVRHQRPIYAFLTALVPNPTERDDVYQQTCLLLWERYDEYDPARPFFPWACGFARNKAFEHLRRRRREAPTLSPESLTRIATAREVGDATAEARRTALDACIRKLSEDQRNLLQQRYAAGLPLKDLADVLATTAAALTMRLQRIRHALLRCIEHAIATTEGR